MNGSKHISRATPLQQSDKARQLIRAILALTIVLLPVGAIRAATTASGDVTPLPIAPNSFLQIGNQSVGSLLIDGGSTLASSSAQLGQNSSGIGFATVTGAGSTWTTNGMTVGINGLGRVDVRDGANVIVDGNGLTLGQSNSGSGTFVIQNAGSILQLTGQLNVGGSGVGLLQIADNAIVNIPNNSTQVGGQNGEQSISLSRLELTNGLLRTSFLTNRGVITGFGEVDLLSSSTSQNYGRLEADGGRLLVGGTSAGLLQNNGIIAADGSELEFARLVTNILSGLTAPQITLRDGTIRFPLIGTSQSGLNNDGILAAIGGVDDVFGRISNTSNGNIAVTNDSVLTFHHDVTSSGGTVSVFPGSKAIFLQDLTMSGGALLLADLAGTNSTTGFGRVEVVGHAQLNSASLQVTLSDGYTPKAGDTFSLVAAAGGIQGMPTLGQMPSLPTGLMWHLNVDAHRVELNVVTPVAGDYNGNGIVDAADYTMWRDSLGQIGPGLAADGNHDSIVNSHDYDVWSANFGTIAGGGTAAMSPSPVEAPEPSACVLGIVGVAVVIGRLISHQRL